MSARRRHRSPSYRLVIGRRGSSLVEVIVGLVVLAVGMVGVAGMLTQGARRTIQVSTQSGRIATEMQHLSRLAVIPYDSLPLKTGCATVSNAPFKHTRCIAVFDSAGGAGFRTIRLIVTPANGRLRADTMLLVRTRGVAINPLGT